MSVYTRNGDDGKTLGDKWNNRYPKDNCNIQVFGDLDELNCNIGLLSVYLSTNRFLLEGAINWLVNDLQFHQEKLFEVGAAIFNREDIENSFTHELEKDIDGLTKILPKLKNFILPNGGNICAAQSFNTRAICRRAERSLVSTGISCPKIKMYLNRLSDYFFMIGRYLSTHEIEWKPK